MDRAVQLFAQHQDYVSAITLAGAADEILGTLLKNTGKTPQILKDLDAIAQSREHFGMPEWQFKDYNLLFNGIRNGLKHHSGDESLQFDERQEAINMLSRCIDNYLELTGEEPEHLVDFAVMYPARWRYE